MRKYMRVGFTQRNEKRHSGLQHRIVDVESMTQCLSRGLNVLLT